MSLSFEYTHDARVYVAQQKYQSAAAWAAWKRRYRLDAAQAALLMSAATYTAYRARTFVLLVVFAILVLVSLFQLVRTSKTYRDTLSLTAKDRPKKNVQLIVNDEGLHETVEGIKSFAPWTSVVSFASFEEVLFIELKANLWAMIPRYSLSGTSDKLEHLIDVLQKNGVPERSDVKSA